MRPRASLFFGVCEPKRGSSLPFFLIGEHKQSARATPQSLPSQSETLPFPLPLSTHFQPPTGHPTFQSCNKKRNGRRPSFGRNQQQCAERLPPVFCERRTTLFTQQLLLAPRPRPFYPLAPLLACRHDPSFLSSLARLLFFLCHPLPPSCALPSSPHLPVTHLFPPPSPHSTLSSPPRLEPRSTPLKEFNRPQAPRAATHEPQSSCRSSLASLCATTPPVFCVLWWFCVCVVIVVFQNDSHEIK